MASFAYESLWKSMKIYKNLWKPMENLWKSMKINENQYKSIKNTKIQ